ncbi:MAG: T9SS type A sorting domain-containing protein [Saprospiraceae bacterium]|nr:hypothetical protein [Lewinellaceae bacterium]
MPVFGLPYTLTSAEQSEVAQKVTHYAAFNFHPLELWSEIYAGSGEGIEFLLNVGDDTITLNLEKSILYPEGARMMIRGDSTPLLLDLENDGIFRGFVNGDTNLVAGFLIRKDQMFGYYEDGGEIWFVGSISSLVEEPENDPSSTFIKYRGVAYPDFVCGTPESSHPQDPEQTGPAERIEKEYFFEIAYDVDYDYYIEYDPPALPDDPTREEEIEKDLAEITLKVEGYYKILAPKMQFQIVDINIWTSAASQPYSGGNHTTHWTQGKDWWESNKSCIQRDAVSLMSGRPLGLNGYVKASSVQIMCGSLLSVPCVAFLPYSFVYKSGDTQRISITVAHELAHIFARNGHTCECSIMYDKDNCPPCQSIGGGWDETTAGAIRYRLTPVQVCRPSAPSNFPSDECLLFASPVDLSFELTLEANQVILTNKSVVCPGEEFTASFYNTFDPNGSIHWELGPHLQFSSVQPSSGKIRNITASGVCCYPFDTWIKVSFNHNCYGPVVYQRKVRVNGSFGLDGVYVGPSGVVNTLYTVNGASAGSSYDIRLENKNAVYTWVQTTGNNTATLPYTTYSISFGMPAQLSTSFFISTPNECGTMNRTVAFVPPFGSFRIKSRNNTANIFPNPSSDMLTIDMRKIAQDVNGDIHCSILDGKGQLVTALVLPLQPYFQIDISILPAGIYFLQMTGERIEETGRFQKL